MAVLASILFVRRNSEFRFVGLTTLFTLGVFTFFQAKGYWIIPVGLSMAVGEYVSVSSLTDTENADITREAQELKEMPEIELDILTQIYEKRGLKKETAAQVAKELTQADALGTDIWDELGLNYISQANPIQEALVSAASFTFGGILPMLAALFAPMNLWSNPCMDFLLFLGHSRRNCRQNRRL
jgi:hypothetical protein